MFFEEINVFWDRIRRYSFTDIKQTFFNELVVNSLIEFVKDAIRLFTVDGDINKNESVSYKTFELKV